MFVAWGLFQLPISNFADFLKAYKEPILKIVMSYKYQYKYLLFCEVIIIISTHIILADAVHVSGCGWCVDW